MIKQIEDLVKDLGTKPTWSAKEMLPKLQSVSSQLENQLANGGQLVNVVGGKKTKVSVIKKYDILYVPVVGVPHYFMVHKVVNQVVYGIIFTSTDKPSFCIHEVKKDRNLEGSFATNSYLSVDLPQAMNSFIRVYESKAEADLIFTKVSDHYREIFKIK
jgi:hypothetical protein